LGEEEDASGPRGCELIAGRPRRPLVRLRLRRRRRGMNLDSNSFFHFNYDWEGKI